MSKKGRKKSGSDAAKSDSMAETLQAVLLIDTYNLYFSPISNQCPHALFPVANEPILCYTLHFLKSAGVQELFIVGKHLTKELEELIESFPLTHKGSQLSVQLLFSDGCDSVGTCLKHLHFSQQINSDFILLLGCVVSNMDLIGILKDHKSRTKKNSGSMMTMVFQRGAPQQSSRTQESDLAVMLSKVEKQLLFYEKTEYRTKVKFPLQKILAHSSVKIHYDLQDTALCICSPQVPQLFSDNFDYQTLEDFINGVLVDEELLGNQIHTHILDDKSYLASATTPLLYHCINTDVMERWTYPYVPDTNMRFSPSDQYEYSRRNIYKGTCVTLERGCRLEENVVIGKQCHINTGAFITRSVLGENVSVGENVKIVDSYIWANVTIQDNCSIMGCIIANNVVINSQCKINSGSFISQGLVIGPETCLPSGTRLIKIFEDSASNVDMSSDATATVSRQSLSHSTIDIGSDKTGTNITLIDATSKKPILLTEDTVWGACKPKIEIVIRPETPDIVAGSVDQEESFYRELLEIVRFGVTNKVSVNDIQTEIMSRRHAFAISMENISLYIVQVVLEGPTQAVSSAQELLNYVRMAISYLVKIFKTLVVYCDDQIALINALETISIDNHRALLIFQHILYHLYEEEIIGQEAIFTWHSSEPLDDAQNKRNEMRKSVNRIVEWLKTAEEESSSSD